MSANVSNSDLENSIMVVMVTVPGLTQLSKTISQQWALGHQAYSILPQSSHQPHKDYDRKVRGRQGTTDALN